ncbi:hypothetical protein ACFFJ4_16005 [Xanthomonas dyei]|uniref:hypothetical protein n=1 Tax=Xanthomonas dyei TaxID=743699 RepID=UPI001FD38278|nr:hypothetical protein [Xanthomonas dyei]
MSRRAIALLALAACSLMAAAPTLPGAGFEVEVKRYHVQLRPDLSTTALSPEHSTSAYAAPPTTSPS